MLLANEHFHRIYVAFRGTASTEDWKDNLKAFQEEGSSVMKIIRGRLHSGFLLRAKGFPADKILNDEGYRGRDIVVCGHSLGGAVATRLAAEMCEAGTPPGGLILRATFSSLTDEAAWHYPFFPVRMLLLDRYPSAERMGSVSCPVIQIHGALDDIVPIELGRKLFASVPERSASGIGKQFVELPRTGHNDISQTQISDAARVF